MTERQGACHCPSSNSSRQANNKQHTHKFNVFRCKPLTFTCKMTDFCWHPCHPLNRAPHAHARALSTCKLQKNMQCKRAHRGASNKATQTVEERRNPLWSSSQNSSGHLPLSNTKSNTSLRLSLEVRVWGRCSVSTHQTVNRAEDSVSLRFALGFVGNKRPSWTSEWVEETAARRFLTQRPPQTPPQPLQTIGPGVIWSHVTEPTVFVHSSILHVSVSADTTNSGLWVNRHVDHRARYHVNCHGNTITPADDLIQSGGT